MEIEGLHKQGLPPRDHSAELPERATSPTTWAMGAITVFAVICLVLFGTSRSGDITASSPNQGVTTGAAPASPQKRTE
jgi:hypothetical protein